MIIKKFVGKTEDEAMKLAQSELGDNLVVMNVKSIKAKGFFSFLKPMQKEITVALEEDTSADSREEEKRMAKQEEDLRQAVAAVSEIAGRHLEEMKSKKEKPDPQTFVNQIAKEMKPEEVKLEKPEEKEEKVSEIKPASSEEKETEENSNVEFFKLLYNIMLDNEVDERYANQLIDDLDKSMKKNMPIDFMLSNVYQKMILKFGQPAVIEPAQKGPKFVFFIGPTGVGKTTTIAKIASSFIVDQRKKVALLTADTYRIAATEQLKTYANILGVPFRIVYTPQEVEACIQDFHDYDYVLVDTAGHSHHNTQQRGNMSQFVHALDYKVEKEVYLVVSATTKYSDLLSIADTYKEMTDYKLIFTKLDETNTLGNLFNLKLHTGAQMSYVTVGQNVPDDIATFDPQETVKMLIGGNQF